MPPQVCVDVCDGLLRFFEFHQGRESHVPRAFGTLEFPRVHMGKAEMDDLVEAKAALTAFVAKHGYDKAHVIVHEGEVYVFSVTLPTVKSGEIRSSIESVLEENVPMDPSEAVFEYDVIGTDLEKGETVVAVSVISEKTLGKYIDLFVSSGIAPVSFQTESRALTHSLFVPHDSTARIVVLVGERHSTIFVAQGRSVVFSSTVEVGTFDIDTAIAREFGIDLGAARTMKEESGFSSESEDSKLFKAITPVLSVIRDEVGKVTVYWKGIAEKNGSLSELVEVVLCGKDAALFGFSWYLSLSVKLPTRLGHVHSGVCVSHGAKAKFSPDDLLDYGVVIGCLV